MVGGLYFQPADLINLKATAGFKLTAGAVEHFGINNDSDGFGNDCKFKTALGFYAGASWRWVGVGYTHIDYKDKNSCEKFDASSIGATFSWEF